MAAEDRRDAVVARRADGAVPEHLGVVVCVHIDEAGAYDASTRVERLRRAFVDPTDCRDASVLDSDVTVYRRRAGAIDDAAVANNQIEHDLSPMRGLRQCVEHAMYVVVLLELVDQFERLGRVGLVQLDRGDTDVFDFC